MSNEVMINACRSWNNQWHNNLSTRNKIVFRDFICIIQQKWIKIARSLYHNFAAWHTIECNIRLLLVLLGEWRKSNNILFFYDSSWVTQIAHWWSSTNCLHASYALHNEIAHEVFRCLFIFTAEIVLTCVTH